MNKKTAEHDKTTRSIVIGVIHLGIAVKSLIPLSECPEFGRPHLV
jgi:hypothetical protein